MMYQDNDTLNKGQQNKKQVKDEQFSNKDAMTAKLLASVAAGMVIGSGATFAAGYLNKATEDAPAEDVNAETASDESQQTPEDINTAIQPTIEERVERLEEKERMREQREQERQHHVEKHQKNEEDRKQKHDDDDKDQNDNDIFKAHDVKIESVETRTLDDGTTVQIYSGTIDGHEAAFMAYDNGQVVAAIVDVNDNGDVDDNEMIDLRESNVTTHYLAQHQVAPAPENDVHVLAVEHDVELGGENVDVAIVSMHNEEVMLVDTNQNGEVDIAIVDQNHNGTLDEGEVQDVSDAHITMPTADDINGSNMIAGIEDGTEDYSNDADVTYYEV